MAVSCVCTKLYMIYSLFCVTCVECCVCQPLSSHASSVVILSNIVLGVSASANSLRQGCTYKMDKFLLFYSNYAGGLLSPNTKG